MSRFDDLFDKSPSEALTRKIEAAVAPLLSDYRAQSRKQFFMFLGALSASFALSAVFVLRLFKDEQAADNEYAMDFVDMSEEDLQVVNEMEAFEDLSSQDFDLLIKMADEEDV